MNVTHCIAYLLLSSAAAISVSNGLAQAQIAPAANDANTVITRSGNTFDITGGTEAGANHFHSFQTFGLNADQIANFRSNPAVQNILGRVVGGDASVINGLIRVTGSNAHLYLMNPAGIVFGTNARLDVIGSFTATTATGVGFGNRWFSAIGSNDYAALVGNPSSLAFSLAQPGAIVNAGNLTVGTNQNLVLLGGTVVNTGQLVAPSGNVLMAAVPGQSLVRLSQPGSLLSFEIAPILPKRPRPAPGETAPAVPSASLPNAWTLPIASLPALLTGGAGGNVTGLTVNNDGTISLSGSGVRVNAAPRTTIASGTIDASTTMPGQIGGTVSLLGDRVTLLSANLNASGTNGGGTVRIGGDYKGLGTVPNAQQTAVSADTVIQADALTSGNGGRAIVWSNQQTEFYGTIRARGGAQAGNGGFVEVSSPKNLIYRGVVDTSAPHGKLGTLLLDPENIVVQNGTQDGDDNGIVNNAFGNNLTGDNGQVRSGDAAPTIIYESELEGLTTVANIILEASNNITIQDLTDDALEIPALTGAGTDRGTITFTADADGNGSGNFAMNLGDTLRTNARDLTITGTNITVGNVETVGAADVAGSINITGASIETGNLRTGFGFSDTSAVTLTATTGDVIVKTISSGGGGIDIKAARYFRATDFFIAFVRTIFDPVEDAEFIQFLSKGNPQSFADAGLFDGVSQVQISLPTSLQTFPDAGPAPIRIQHGGEARTVGSGQVQIQGTGTFSNAQFVVGPNNDHTITFLPGGGGFAATFDDFSTLFPPGAFPSDLSGATGAILRGQGDATLVTSLQNRPFDPTRVVTETPTGNTGGGGTGSGGTGGTGGGGTGGGSGVNTASLRLGEEGQVAQRQLNAQNQSSACGTGAIASAAGVSGSRGGDRATTTTATINPCSATNDDAQILQILDSSSQP